jgi:hypothetical protein
MTWKSVLIVVAENVNRHGITSLFCSDKLLEAVIQETLKEVATTKQVQSDQTQT